MNRHHVPANILTPKPTRAELFTWHGDTKTFVAEASSLGARAGTSPFGRVYADACDEGLTLVSRYSGRQDIVFVVSHTEVSDGDLLWWDLVPADRGIAHRVNFKLRVFND